MNYHLLTTTQMSNYFQAFNKALLHLGCDSSLVTSTKGYVFTGGGLLVCLSVC